MEEDTGKSLHVGGATGRIHGADYSLVDYNRAGIPLIEIVTKPVEGTGALAPAGRPGLRHRAARADAHPRRLRRADGAGLAALRRQPLAAPLAVRPARHPLRDEERQLAALGRAGRALRDRAGRPPCSTAAERVVQETRHWHEDTGSTTSGRSKEQAEDYRYFPEPDLVPVAPDRGVGRGAAGRAAAVARPYAVASCRRPGASPTSRCSRWSTPAPSTSSRAPSRPVRRPRPPASGGSASWPGSANERGVDLAELPITPGAGRAGGRARRVGSAQRQAGPPGHRGRAGRRGRARRGRRRVAGSRSSATTPRCSPRSTRRWPRTRTSRRRSAAARSRPPAPSSARS